MNRTGLILLILLVSFFIFFNSSDISAESKVSQISDHIYLLTTNQINSVLYADDEISVLITNEPTDITDNLLESARELAEKPLKFIISSHFHNNADNKLAFTDPGSIFILHENSRDLFINSISPNLIESYNTLSFKDEMYLKTGKEEIQVIHVPNAHTESDIIVYFKNANVLYTGNLFYSYSFPVIDLFSGGSISGYIDGTNFLIKIADDKTDVIPATGSASNEYVIKKFRKMVVNSRNRIELQIHAERQLDIILNDKPLEDFSVDRWGRGEVSSSDFVKNLYRGLATE